MIWNNAKKSVRKNWYAVPAPHLADKGFAAHWCRQQKSIGRFYHHYTNTRWWFECEQDAMMFTMKWSLSQARRSNEMNRLNTLLRQARKVTTSTGPK